VGTQPTALTAGHSAEEMDKRLVAALREKRSFLFLDNYNAKNLQSDTLASALTEDPCEVRILGQGKNVRIYTKTFFAATGNGVTLSEDMLRRILKITLDAHVENPEQRKFKGDFLPDVMRDRLKLLQAVLTIWRWGRQSDVTAGKPLGSYGQWARWCRDPLLALGCRDPIDRVAQLKAADPRRQAVIEVFEMWWKKHGDKAVLLSELDDEVKLLIDRKGRRR
jgi:putative DNA primase/helicase